MDIILREDVTSLGDSGDMVVVKDGYARNYLIPRGLAVMATSRNVRRLEHDKRVIAQRDQKRHKDAEGLKARLEGLSLTISKNTGAEDKLFGSVTNREVAEAIKTESGLEVNRKSIQLEQSIKSLGVYSVGVKLTRDIAAKVKLWVVSK